MLSESAFILREKETFDYIFSLGIGERSRKAPGSEFIEIFLNKCGQYWNCGGRKLIFRSKILFKKI